MDVVFSHEYFMQQALKEAHKAFDEGEIPVGAVVVCNNRIIGKGHNLTQKLNDVTAHAEMQAITAASNYLGAKYLTDCTLYVTLEPCVMCAGAIFWSQAARLVYGAEDPKRGFSRVGDLLHPKTELVKGVMGDEAAELVKTFFKKKRDTV
jgi:tRNA(adenine34) deaminase